ncbi:MAG TPA: ABC transporter permease [Pseudobdellovibrionaceae bacterium]|jgi:dipeptide transport system permease protein
MFLFLSKKILEVSFTLVGITFICFLLLRLVPGDPVLLMIGERNMDPVAYAEAKQKLGLDKPVLVQFGKYIEQVASGDLGTSVTSKTSVWTEFKERFPATVELSFVALLFATLFAIPFGVLAALKKNTFFDYFLMGSSLTGYSMPIFWWGLVLILLFSVKLGWTPVSGRIAVEYDIPLKTGFYLLDSLQRDVREAEGLKPFWSAVSHLILPSIVLGTIPLAVMARMTRSSFLEVLGEDYIRTARAKGLSEYRVVLIHSFRNALIPIVTTLALCFGSIITGAILTETIFSWPGIGRWIVTSITSRDYPTIQGGVLIISVIIIITNTLVDLLYIYLNPRIKNALLK